IGVAVEDEEALAEQLARTPDRAERSLEARCVVAVLDRDAEALVPDRLLDALAEVADAEHDPADAVAREQAQLMDQEGLPGDFDQRLRRVLHPDAEPGPESAREDADRRHR